MDATRTRKQREYERFVAERFLLHLIGNWRIDEQPTPPAPDIMIANGVAQFGLELCRYREQGPHNEQQEVNSEFEQFVLHEWLYDDSVNECTPHLDWRKNSRSRFVVPRKNRWEPFVVELKRLAVTHRPCDHDTAHHVFFVRGQECETAQRVSPGIIRIETCDFPIIAEYCRRVWLTLHSGVMFGLPRSSMHTRPIGVDTSEIQRLTAQKSRKLVDYRRLTNSPVWLVFHSDGWPSTSLLPSFDGLDRACRAVFEARPTDAREWFDAVWWIDFVMTQNGSEARLIHPATPPAEYRTRLSSA
jgi:hypothetical protein